MALKATVIKARLNVSDMTRHHYQDYALTVAQHPSETEQRLMIRLLAFALYAQESLRFTKGLCADDEPELWAVEPDETISLWIDLGLPDEKRIKKACSRAKHVVVIAYGENTQSIWWQKLQSKVSQHKNLSVISLAYEQTQQLAEMAQRNIDIAINIDEQEAWVSNDNASVQIPLTFLQSEG